MVHLGIDFAGIIAFDRVDIYSKTYYLKDDREVQEGVYCGIDNENRLVRGTLTINFTAS